MFPSNNRFLRGRNMPRIEIAFFAKPTRMNIFCAPRG